MAVVTEELAARYLSEIEQLHPPGVLAAARPGTRRRQVWQALARLSSAIHCRALELGLETLPQSTFELLPDWEEAMGLPECDGLSPNTEQRRATVVAKLRAQGGQSIAHFVEVAAEAGWRVEFEEVLPCTVISRCTDRVYTDGWRFVYYIHAPVYTPRFFTAGGAAAGDYLVTFDNEGLGCLLDPILPAHQLGHYVFDLTPPSGPWSEILPTPAVATMTTPSIQAT